MGTGETFRLNHLSDYECLSFSVDRTSRQCLASVYASGVALSRFLFSGEQWKEPQNHDKTSEASANNTSRLLATTVRFYTLLPGRKLQ
jgi:hypothetical protein